MINCDKTKYITCTIANVKFSQNFQRKFHNDYSELMSGQ